MGFFGWFFLIIFSIYVVFRLFGRQISQFLMRKMMSRVAKEFENQARQYQKNYGGDPYYDRIHVDDEIEVNIPKHNPTEETKIPGLESIAEDIEFEEIRDELPESSE